MAISNPTGTQGGDSLESIRKQLRDFTAGQQSFQTQINSQPQLIGVTNRFPSGAPSGSLAVRQMPDGSIGLSVSNGKGFGAEIPVAAAGPNASSYLGVQSGTGGPTTTNFATDGSYGWWLNTSANTLYWTVNIGGSMRLPSFVSLSGTITDAQHGARAGGSLHAAATTSAAGFLSAIDKINYDATTGIVADLTQTGTPSYFVNATSYYVGGTQVLTGQMNAIAPLATTATLSDVITAFNTLLVSLKAAHLMHA